MMGEYKFGYRKVRLPKHDNDLTVTLPGGIIVTLQYRCEGPSLDVLLSEPLSTVVWKDCDMTPARIQRNGLGKAQQIVFSLPEPEGK
jgi:hypothetical protein